jgi:hypothetical protein
MKYVFALAALFIFSLGWADGRKGHSAPRAQSKPQSFSFPKYNRPSTPKASHPSVYKVPVRHDSMGNHITEDHMNRVDFAKNRADTVMRTDNHVTDVVHIGRTHYVNYFRPEFDHKRVFFTDGILRYNNFVITNPLIIDTWHHHYFFGGFYYGFHPVLDIDTYFYNPSVYWFYVGSFDEGYYRSWYQDHYDAYPQFHKAFEFHGVYYPTDNLRQLLFGVSAMPSDKQARFRTAITNFTRLLAQGLANGLGKKVTLTKGDIAVTHYEIIGYDDAIVLEGVVNHNNKTYNFKGLLDLETPGQTSVFVPATWDKDPTPEQLAKLDELNSRIGVIKGEPLTSVTANPGESSELSEPPPPPPAGEVTAEPEK